MPAESTRIRFCLTIDHSELTRGQPDVALDRTIGYAKLADAAGLDSIWLTEDPDGWDAFAMLGALTRETSSIRLGTGVTNIFHRYPNLMAGSIATIDRLSGGRAFLGLGRGQPEVYDRTFGIDTSRHLIKMEDAISLLRQWWSDDLTARGPGLAESASWPRTLGPLHQPSIYIAAVGPKALELAGRVADGVLFNEMATPEFVHWAVERASSAAVEAGRDPAALRYFVNPALRVTDDPEAVLERKKTFVALILALPGMDRLLMTDAWDVPGIMAGVRDAMQTQEVLDEGGLFVGIRKAGDLERARSLIPVELVAAGTAIGSMEYVRKRLGEYVAAGATDIFIDRRGMPDDPGALRQLLAELTAPEDRSGE